MHTSFAPDQFISSAIVSCQSFSSAVATGTFCFFSLHFFFFFLSIFQRQIHSLFKLLSFYPLSLPCSNQRQNPRPNFILRLFIQFCCLITFTLPFLRGLSARGLLIELLGEGGTEHFGQLFTVPSALQGGNSATRVRSGQSE